MFYVFFFSYLKNLPYSYVALTTDVCLHVGEKGREDYYYKGSVSFSFPYGFMRIRKGKERKTTGGKGTENG
jgi:hypothetical protein